MCFKVENYLAEVYEGLAPSERHLLIFHENQRLTHSPLPFPAQIFSMPRNLRKRVMLQHDVSEDG